MIELDTPVFQSEAVEADWVQAEMRGLKYQTYLKMLIHEALVKADQSGTPA